MPVNLTCPECGAAFCRKPSRATGRRFCSEACASKSFRRFSGDGNPHWQGGDVRVLCKFCSREYFVCRARSEATRFCSRKCLTLWQKTQIGPLSKVWGQRRQKEKKPGARQGHWRAPPVKIRIAARPTTLCPVCGAKRRVAIGAEVRCLRCRPKIEPLVQYVCSSCQKIVTHRRIDKKKTTLCIRCLPKTRSGKLNSNWKGGITTANRQQRQSPEYRAWRIAVFTRDGYVCQLCGQKGGTLHAHHIEPFSVETGLRLDVGNGQTLCVSCHRKTDSFLRKAKTWGKHRKQLTLAFDPLLQKECD